MAVRGKPHATFRRSLQPRRWGGQRLPWRPLLCRSRFGLEPTAIWGIWVVPWRAPSALTGPVDTKFLSRP